MSPIIRECQKRKLDFFVLHTNQHYSKNLDDIFFEELNLPKPKYNLGVGSGTHVQQIGKMMSGIEEIFIKEKPDIVLVEGDTNTVLAGALVSVKMDIKIGHIEAGLRSYFNGMPEEINRVLTDHCSSVLFAPTAEAKGNLLKEGISKNKIIISGNTIVDAVNYNFRLAVRRSSILKDIRIDEKKYFLLTLHRQENVDFKLRLENIIRGLELVYKKFGLPIVFPIHPRTRKRIDEFSIELPAWIRVIEPVGYLDFLNLEINARLIFTDSGGVQEESCILKVPCITLRDNTERPETLKIKSSILAGENPKKILNSSVKMMNKNIQWKNPFGDGKSAERIIKILMNND